MDITELKQIPVFEGVAEDYLLMITADMWQTFSDGQVIFQENDASLDLMILTYGQVCVRFDDTYIVCRTAPAVIGEQALINDSVRSATVTAQGFAKAIVIPNKIAKKLFESREFLFNLLKAVSEKLRDSTYDRGVRYKNEELLFGEFRAHVSPEVTSRLLATGVNYGAPRFIENAVIMLSDIRSFTQISARMSPQQIAEQLSLYLSEIVDIIHRHGGTVDKFIGDAVLAFWGFSEFGTENQEEKAFRCAVEMFEAANRMTFGEKEIEIGVGLNQGEVFVGNVGSDGKRQFTILGTPVNLAARYESLSKELASPIVVGEVLHKNLPPEIQSFLIPHSELEIKGAKTQTVYSFNPLKTAEDLIKGEK